MKTNYQKNFFLRNVWKILRPILFQLSPETAHNFIIQIARYHPANWTVVNNRQLTKRMRQLQSAGIDLSVHLGKIKWPNPIGLAAGLDKNAVAIRFFSSLGFGAVEVGTVTPLAQPGNALPRLFRIVEKEALLNRMGFNNHGMEQMRLQIIKKMGNITGDAQQLFYLRHFSLGINIGKNKNTPLEDAASDYVKSAAILLNHADYFVINVSSPNTPGLRGLQEKEQLNNILVRLQKENLLQKKPFFLKLAPDLALSSMIESVGLAQQYQLNGVILSNTTIHREGILPVSHKYFSEAGGISGRPLKAINLNLVSQVRKEFSDFPIIAAGGIFSFADMRDYLAAGASACQIYSGFIYNGPFFILKILNELVFDMKKRKINSFKEYLLEIRANAIVHSS